MKQESRKKDEPSKEVVKMKPKNCKTKNVSKWSQTLHNLHSTIL